MRDMMDERTCKCGVKLIWSYTDASDDCFLCNVLLDIVLFKYPIDRY